MPPCQFPKKSVCPCPCKCASSPRPSSHFVRPVFFCMHSHHVRAWIPQRPLMSHSQQLKEPTGPRHQQAFRCIDNTMHTRRHGCPADRRLRIHTRILNPSGHSTCSCPKCMLLHPTSASGCRRNAHPLQVPPRQVSQSPPPTVSGGQVSGVIGL